MSLQVSDIWNYIIGNYRFWAYHHVPWVIRKHIKEQFEYRVSAMNPECYNQGSCIKCGCTTPNLQMAAKTCEGNCYPPLMTPSLWEWWKDGVRNSTYTGKMEQMMYDWDQVHVDLGEVKAGTTVPVLFTYKGKYPLRKVNGKPILKKSCGCSKPSWLPKTNQVKVDFTPTKVPAQRQQVGWYMSTKNVTVEVQTPAGIRNDVLKFTAKVHD